MRGKKKMTFADELRHWRARLDISQPKAADLLGVKYSTLRDWEQGIAEPATIKAVRHLMAAELEGVSK